MLDTHLASIETLRAQGAVVLIKWDGERSSNPYSVVITRKDTDFVWRQDSNDIERSLLAGLQDYETHHAQ